MVRQQGISVGRIVCRDRQEKRRKKEEGRSGGSAPPDPIVRSELNFLCDRAVASPSPSLVHPTILLLDAPSSCPY